MSISSEGDERPISQRHSSIPTVTEFRDAFWGDGGLDILLQNTKQANNASKELEGFVRDRAKAEEQIGKDLQKAAKHNAQVGAHIGAFAPAWMELVCAYSDKVALAHLSLASKLMELAKEISAYHNHQKEQYRLSKDQAVTPCAEALSALEQTTSHANKCKVMYHQAHHQACELVEHLSKINREAHKQKDLEKLESRLKKADSHAQQSESDYKASLQKQETARQDFRDKMTVLADRLQKTEMEHLSQMKKFVATILTVERKMESTVEFVKKHQDKETTLSAEVMLQQFVAVRGSGTTLAPALKFEPPPTEMPVLPAVSALTGQVQSSSSLPSVSPDPGSDAASAKKKWLRKKKKKEKGKGEKEGDTPSATPGPEASVDVDVDEEGYSIRPDNADRVGSKDDKDSDFSYGSDSDEPETESKLRSISIRPVNATQDKAISDNSSDLTAAVQSLSILKPPGKTSSNEPTSRSSPARNFLDDDIGGAVPPLQPMGSGSMLEPLGILTAAPVSSGSATPPTSTKDPSSGIMKPHVPGLGSSPGRFTPESPRSQSPLMVGRRMSSGSLGSNTNSSGNASSPHGTGLSVYALFNETVNALFKGSNLSSTLIKVTGELQLSFPSTCLGQITPLAPPLVLRIHPTSGVDQAHANTHLLETDSTSPSGDVCYRFKMAPLQAFLKTQHEAAPNAAFFKVDVFKYHAKVTSAAALPIHVNCLWKSDETVANLKVNYAYNPQCRLNPAPIKFVSFLTPTEGVSNVQSSGQSQWANDRLVWKIPEIAAGTSSSLLAKMDLKSGPGRPPQVAVQFSFEGQCLSGLNMDIASPGYHLALMKYRLATGRYMAEV